MNDQILIQELETEIDQLKTQLTKSQAELTELKNSGKKNCEFFFKSTLYSIGDAVITSCNEGTIRHLNTSAAQLSGWNESDATGKLLAEVIQIVAEENQHINLIGEILQNSRLSGFKINALLVSKNKLAIPIGLQASAIVNENGEQLGTVLVFRDLTSERLAQIKSNEMASLFQNLSSDNTKNIHSIVSHTCNLLDANSSLYNKLVDDGKNLEICSGFNLPEDMILKDLPDGHICNEAIKGDDDFLAINDLSRTSFFESDPNIKKFGIHAYLGSTVKLNGKNIGVLAVVYSEPRNFSSEEIDRIKILARLVSLEEERNDTISILKTAIEVIPSGFLIADAPDVNIRFTNPAALNIRGKTETQLTDIKVENHSQNWQTFHIDGTPYLSEELPLSRAVLKGETTNNEEVIIRNDNGKEHYVSVNAAPIINSSGAISSGVVIFHDITEHKKALQYLTESEKRYRNLFEKVPLPMWVYDLETLRFLIVNKAATINYGYSEKEFLQMTIKDIRPAEDVDMLLKNMLRDATDLNDAGIWRHKKKNGEIIFVEVTSFKIDYSGRKARLLLANDITKRREMVEEMKKSEERYRITTEQTGQLVYDYDIKTGKIAWFGAIEKQLGYTNEEFNLGGIEFWTENIHPDERTAISEELNNAIIEVRQFNVIYRFKCKNGEYKIYLDRGGFQVDNKGFASRMLGMMTDITEQKRFEATLKNSEKRYRNLFNFAPIGLTIIDEKGKIVDVNNTFLMKTSFTYDELIGKDIRILVPEKTRTVVDQNIKRILNGEILETEVESIIKGNRKEYAMLSEIKTILPNGEVGILSASNYITSRKQAEFQREEALKALKFSEKKYRELFETNLDGIIIFLIGNTFESWKIVEVNPAICKMTGFSEDELLSKHFSELVKIFGNQNIAEKLSDTQIEDKIIFESTLFHKDKSEIYTEFLSQFMLYNGKPSVISIIRDVSEKKKYIEDIVFAKEKAENNDNLKTTFLRSMSHEIRTPLNGILGFANILASEELEDDEVKTYGNVINNSGNRLLELFDNLIDISEIETEEIILNYTTFPLIEIIKEIEDYFKLRISSKNIILVFKIDTNNENKNLYTDRQKLVKILKQLLSNAIKFTNSGEIEISFKESQNEIQFSVKDSGNGIAEEQFSKIFDSFYQIDMSLTRQFEGAGLGLSICKGYIEKMNGKIWLNSELNHGTTFYFSVPTHNISTHKTDNQTITNNEEKQKSILVAEDDDLDFELIDKILKKSFFKILRAKNGVEAIEICKQNKEISLVLLDLNMPVLQGTEAIKHIKEFRRNLKVIAISSFANKNEIIKALEAGCDDYITKPILKEKLITTINKHENRIQKKL